MSRSHPLPKLAAPAERALGSAGLDTLEKVARAGEAQVAALHGMGPRALQELRKALAAADLMFRR